MRRGLAGAYMLIVVTLSAPLSGQQVAPPVASPPVIERIEFFRGLPPGAKTNADCATALERGLPKGKVVEDVVRIADLSDARHMRVRLIQCGDEGNYRVLVHAPRDGAGFPEIYAGFRKDGRTPGVDACRVAIARFIEQAHDAYIVTRFGTPGADPTWVTLQPRNSRSISVLRCEEDGWLVHVTASQGWGPDTPLAYFASNLHAQIGSRMEALLWPSQH